MKQAKLNDGRVFINTLTYKSWQSICRLRDKVKVTLGVGEEYSYRKPTDELIVKYILPSKTFTAWYKMYSVEQWVIRTWLLPTYIFVKRYIPQPVKQKLKVIFSVLSGQSTFIDPRIVREWKKWVDERPDNSMDIFNFGVIPYEYRFQRPQQLAVSAAKQRHRVFYIETEFNLSLFPKRTKIKVKKASENVYVVTLTAPSNYFIYTDTPSKRGQGMLISSLKILIDHARIINPVAKIDHPFWVSISDSLAMPLVYDVMDLHEGFKVTGSKIATIHDEMVRKADVVIASSDYLEKTVQKAKSVVHIKNAGDYDHFSVAQKMSVRKPTDLKMIQKPIIGYYGALAEWFDVELVRQVASAFPDHAIVLIGRVQNSELLRAAKEYKNIYLLGEKPYQELPKYVSYFNVCMIPFHVTELIKATNPVKIYEYFAAGKPVVSTAIPELNSYKDVLYMAKSYTEYINGVRKALKEKSPKLISARLRIARENTWDVRGKTLINTLLPVVFPSVSVVILTYNNPRLSQIAIESVLYRSKYGNMGVIIVDNASGKDTRMMLKKYQGLKRVKIIINPRNYGFAKGNNVGMKKAEGDYIVLLNNDVRVTPGWLSRLAYHSRHDGIGLIGPVTNAIGNESKIDIKYDPEDIRDLEKKASAYTSSHWGEILKLKNIAAFAWLMPRSVYKKVGGLDERFGRGLFEDDDYCLRVRKSGFTIACADDSFVHHYGGASTDWGSDEYQKLFESNKKKFEEKWGLTWEPHKRRKI